MALITQEILNQKFEIIRDRIAEILIEELDNQVLLSGDYDLEVDVTVEDVTPYVSKVEVPWVNVSLLNGKFQAKDQRSVDGAYQFTLDVCTNSKSPANGEASRKSTIQNHRILGVVRSILNDPRYKTLGYVAPYVNRTFFSDLQMFEQNGKDALSTSVGRLIFNVLCPETHDFVQPINIEGYTSHVKVNNTNKGYLYDSQNYS